MEAITKIIRAKSKNRKIEIPKEFESKDVRVTFEPIIQNSKEQKEIEKNLEEFKKLSKLIRTKNIQIPKDMDINKMMNDMNDALH
jgi:hypothetical protein